MHSAIISEDLTIEGDLLAKDSSLTINGKVTGDVTAKSIDVRPEGQVTGTLSAESVVIGGTVKGKVACSDLALEETARVEADLATSSLTSRKGAKLSGRVEVKGA
jgi:cytoskeletal protein CcmA (bactofilin family)